ncbi:hypothetical protein [Claveliimonas bilis]|uniref:hypothetical protein n=1 Tax=Claveliimonas bilis TaxID=3028070 RepID=UPI00292F2679|nr:hypothetical protein [Claveliimonas bilis]
MEMIKKISLLYNVRIEDLLEQENLTDLNRTKETAAKDFIPEKKYIAYFIVVAFLAISCMFPLFGIFTCLLTFYLSRKLNLKSLIIIIFTLIALFFSIWNTWNFINVNFIHYGAATIDVVAALCKFCL